MLAQWTGRIVGECHTHQVSHKELATEVGWNPKYLSQVLNGRECPKGAEEKVSAALERIIKNKNGGM